MPLRTRGLFVPDDPAAAPYPLSRTKLELFLDCPCCFYLDRRRGLARPEHLGLTLNAAVDVLMKAEFDRYRAAGRPHPLMQAHGINAVPLQHPELAAWRNARTQGVRALHADSQFIVFGGVDDIWVQPNGTLIVVDYKATARRAEVSLEGGWGYSYRRQVEVYAWLLQQCGHRVAPTAYFVYANGRADRPRFDDCLTFRTRLLAHPLELDWIEPALRRARACLLAARPPRPRPGCIFCSYAAARSAVADSQ